LTGRCKRAGQADVPLAKPFDRLCRACAATSAPLRTNGVMRCTR